MMSDRGARSYPGYRNHLNWEDLYQALARELDVPAVARQAPDAVLAIE